MKLIFALAISMLCANSVMAGENNNKPKPSPFTTTNVLCAGAAVGLIALHQSDAAADYIELPLQFGLTYVSTLGAFSYFGFFKNEKRKTINCIVPAVTAVGLFAGFKYLTN